MSELKEDEPLTYIGVKVIKAKPMGLLQAQALLKRDFGYDGLTNEHGNADGYLVEYEQIDNAPVYQSWSPADVFEKAYRVAGSETVTLEEAAFDIGMIDEKLYLTSFQERVIQEAAALFNKLRKLIEFFETETFKNLPVDEQERLKLQSQHMDAYWTVLIERTQNFE